VPFAYYDRLSAGQKRIYRRSDEIPKIPLADARAAWPLVPPLQAALVADDRRALERACQTLADALAADLRVPPINLVVLAARPSHDWGELHGLYEPQRGRPPRVTLWMRTARLRRVVAFKSFLRTFLHELCHHLDYELLGLADSFHTEGFYKRESSLFHQLVTDAAAAIAGSGPT